MMVEADQIKLVIWDLDDTLWQGTLSEGDVFPIQERGEWVQRLARCGILNPICSKNDPAAAAEKLKSLDLWEYFVFPEEP